MNMPLLNLIIQPVLGAAAGYITNEYAINMLFKTYTPLKLGGVIPKTREAFIENVSTLVEEDIINKEKVQSILNDEAFTKNFDALIEDFFTKSIYEVSDNLSISDNPSTDKALSDVQSFINVQIALQFPELISSLSKHIKLCDILDKTQMDIAIEKLYLYLLDVLKDTKIADKLVMNVLDDNENISVMDIAGYDASAIISQNISDLLIKNLDIASVIDEAFEKTDITGLLLEFSKGFVNNNEEKLHDRILSIFNGIIRSDEFNEVLFEFSQKLLEYAKTSDIPLLSLINNSCISRFKDILYRESDGLSDVLISFVNSNNVELQNMIEEALNETINEQDTAKKTVLSMAKGSILSAVAKNDIPNLVSEYLHDSNNRLNLCALASAKLKDYLKTAAISQAIHTLEKKEALSVKGLNEFLSTYIFDNSEGIVNTILVYIKAQFNDEAFKNNIIPKLKSILIDKLILSSKTTEFLNSKLSIYLTKLFDTKLKDFVKASYNDDSYAYGNFAQNNFSFNDYIYNYLEQNKEKLILSLSSNISNAIEDKSINDVLSTDLSDETNTISSSLAYEKVNEAKNKISQEKVHNLYDKLNNIDNLHKNSSKLLKGGVINNLDSVLHKFVKGLSVKNLNQLDDNNLIEMAQSFIGNNLKPVMLFGAMLGLIAGFILAFIQPNNDIFALVSISSIFTCAFVGSLTNAIAITMLFRPYREIKILRRIPFFRHFSLGYIAKNKENLANGMSQAISEYLLTKESMDDLIDTYKDDIKESMLYNISKNNYELVSSAFINNKDKIEDLICSYAIETLSSNKNNISAAIADKFESIKINDLLLQDKDNFSENNIKKSSFKNTASEYIVNSKDYLAEQIFKYLFETMQADSANAEYISSGSIASILPKSAVDSIIKSISSASYKGYDELISKLNYENIKNFAEKYDRNYQELINKSLAEIFSINEILSTENSSKIIDSSFKAINSALNSQEKLGEIFNKRISVLSNNFLYIFFENLESNSGKLLKPMHPYLSKAIKDKITSNLNFLAKISYGMMGGDKIVDSVVEKILSDKLPKLVANKKALLYQGCSDYLNSRLLNLSLSELGIALNSEVIVNSKLSSLNNVINPAISFIDKKMACIKVKTLLEPLSLDDIDTMLLSHSVEISDLIEKVNLKLMTDKNEILSLLNVFIDKYLNDMIINTNVSHVFKDISTDEFKNISDKIANIILEKSLVDKSVHDIFSCIKNYDRKLFISELISREEFVESLEKIIEDKSIQPVIKNTIEIVLSQAAENGFAFINSESKEYLIGKAADAVILSLRNNLSIMLNDIEFDKIAREQINEMNPKKIHEMFNSFAGKYFNTLILYGFWGAVFGINTIFGLTLAAFYSIKNFVKKS